MFDYQSELPPNMEHETFNLGCTTACGASMDEYTNQEIIILTKMVRLTKIWIHLKVLIITALELSQTFKIFKRGDFE